MKKGIWWLFGGIGLSAIVFAVLLATNVVSLHDNSSNDNSNNNINVEMTYFEYMSGWDIYSGYVIFYKKTVIFYIVRFLLSFYVIFYVT